METINILETISFIGIGILAIGFILQISHETKHPAQ